jgi:hypothetical protein
MQREARRTQSPDGFKFNHYKDANRESAKDNSGGQKRTRVARVKTVPKIINLMPLSGAERTTDLGGTANNFNRGARPFDWTNQEENNWGLPAPASLTAGGWITLIAIISPSSSIFQLFDLIIRPSVLTLLTELPLAHTQPANASPIPKSSLLFSLLPSSHRISHSAQLF